MRNIATLLGVIGLVGMVAAPVQAGFSEIGAPYGSEASILTIINTVYSTSFTPVGAPHGAAWSQYTDGTLTLTRVDDYLEADGVLGSGGTPGDTLNVVDGAAGLPVTDQWWDDGFTKATADARYAGWNQKFGYMDGTDTYQNLFNVNGYGFGVTGSASMDFTGHTWRWARNGGNHLHSSLDADNEVIAGVGENHLVTYQVTSTDPGFNSGWATWLLFWEDKNMGQSADFDFNDLVVQVRAVPVPGAALLGVIGLGILSRLRRGLA